MKKILLLASGLLMSAATFAQSFTTASGSNDTVSVAYTSGSEVKVYNLITPSSSASPLTLKWKVLSVQTSGTGFDQVASGICDNNQCYSDLPGSISNNRVYTTSPIMTGNANSGDLHAVFQTSGTVSTGAFIKATIRITDTVTNYSRTLTFVAYKAALAIPQVNNDNSVSVYPNPARDFVNVAFDKESDIRTIAIFNLIGKTMRVFKPTDNNSARLDLDNIPSGVYFIRLMNNQGQVIATRRFTRQ